MDIGKQIHQFCSDIWSFDRSLTGEGVRQTLSNIKEICPELQIKEIASGTKVFDWKVPKEWRVKDAWIKKPNGEKICKFKDNNLHLVGYSIPVHKKLSLKELNEHLHSIGNLPHAIPYITSYYEDRWGFCISDDERQSLPEGEYEVFVDAEHFDGVLNYGEILIKGKSEKEIFLSTYVCHPSMANNELSGIGVLTFISKFLFEMKNRRYSYRIVFVPETIGSLVYISENLLEMRAKIIAGFNLTCIGDERGFSYLPSRHGETYSDAVVKHVLSHIDARFNSYSWNQRGSDERQYCAPGIDLPVASIMRTKY